MAHKKPKLIDREAFLNTIRAAVKKSDGTPPTFLTFLRESGIPHSQFYKLFINWSEALKAAGIDCDPGGQAIAPKRLLADWGAVARKIQRVPTAVAYDLHGKYSACTCSHRFGSYRNVAPAFEKFAKGKKEWADILALCTKRKRDGRTRPLPIHRPRQMRARPSSAPSMPASLREALWAGSPLIGRPHTNRPTYGTPLQLPGIATAPVNETGVVFLFGMLAAQLGFHVQTLRTAFPDCEALRQVGPDKWQCVSIEFEYESRNFRDHLHDPKGCDLIVCWNHNWTDCPKNLEVISLRDEIERLKINTPGSEFSLINTGL